MSELLTTEKLDFEMGILYVAKVPGHIQVCLSIFNVIAEIYDCAID